MHIKIYNVKHAIGILVVNCGSIGTHVTLFLTCLLYFDNSAKRAGVNEITPESNYVFIRDDGFCRWEPRYELSVTQCELDLKWFPFDEQSCELVFVSWLRLEDEIGLFTIPFYDGQLINSNDWEIIGK